MSYLRIVTTLDDSWCELVKDDPVRPNIPIEHRVNSFSEIIFLVDEQDEPAAAVCIKFCGCIPVSEDELLADCGENTIAVFYTIWSYKRASGRPLIDAARKHISESRPTVSRFVTLSPKTEMAKNFHTKNGAVTLQENHNTVNYEYI